MQHDVHHKVTPLSMCQAILDARGANTNGGAEAVAMAERQADVLTLRAGSGDPSAVPTICRISAALKYPPGMKNLNSNCMRKDNTSCNCLEALD
jgi:hypothetical protein